MTAPSRKSPDRTGPLPLGTVIDRSRAIIADKPNAAEVERIVRAEVAQRLAKQHAAAQQKLDALRARLTEADDARYEKSLLAAMDGDLCGFSLGAASGNDSAPASSESQDLPKGAQPYVQGEVARAAERGRR